MRVLILIAVTFLAVAQAIELKPVINSVEPKNPWVLLTHNNINKRIAGGDEVNPPHSLPYQAGLFIHTENKGTFLCGGALISTTTVVTAAHCAQLSENIEVILGAHNILLQEDTQVRTNVCKIVIHPKWNQTTLNDNIALLTLSEPVKFNENIQAISLAYDTDNKFIRDQAKTSGWGAEALNGMVSSVLREFTAEVLHNVICQIYFGYMITEHHICILDASKTICEGDIGGPLVASNGTLIGITSFGLPICEVQFPSAFTRVTSYIEWILENSDVSP